VSVAGIGSVLKHAWNVFSNQDEQRRYQPYAPYTEYYGNSTSYRPDRSRLRIANDKSIISSIYTRISVDVASVDMRHVRLDDEDRYLEDIDSGLNNCLTLEANIDQAARALRQDIVMTLFDGGCAAVVPVDTSINPTESGSFDILTLRVGEVTAWFPHHVRVNLYNEDLATRQEITLPKSTVAIIENPLYSVMNEPNSTLQRLFRKLNLLDAVDEQSASGKLDLIIQLPYVIKSEARRQQAEQRRSDIEFQLKGSQYGIAYTDGTEKITQLNRPIENNLMGQVEFLTTMLYGQLGLTDAVMNGTADEKTMLNYWNRTIEPILTATVQEFRRKFLTKTARTQKQSVLFFKDPFSLVPIENIAEIADKFTRNEVLTSNEIRQIIGRKPHPDPKADQLINSNMPVGDTGVQPDGSSSPVQDSSTTNPAIADMSSSFDQIDAAINDAFSGLTSSNGSGP
jgi:putative sterol carrier protein